MTKSRLDNMAPELEKELEIIGLELVEIQYRKEDQEQFLRFFIDREGGITLDNCSTASRKLKELIDQNEIYYDHLEVSSPGIDRPLKTERDLKRHLDCQVIVKTRKTFTGPRTVVGTLRGFSEGELVLEIENAEMIEIPREMASSIRLNTIF